MMTCVIETAIARILFSRIAKKGRTFTTMHIPWSIMLSITLSCNKILHSCLCHEHKHRQRTYSNRSNRQVPRSLVERRPWGNQSRPSLNCYEIASRSTVPHTTLGCGWLTSSVSLVLRPKRGFLRKNNMINPFMLWHELGWPLIEQHLPLKLSDWLKDDESKLFAISLYDWNLSYL